MTPPICSALRFVAVLTLAAPCAAQPRPDPLDAQEPVPALRYNSALQGYRAFTDDKPVPWKDANDTAARIGGWRAYAREARAPAAAAAAAPAAPAASAAQPGIEKK